MRTFCTRLLYDCSLPFFGSGGSPLFWLGWLSLPLFPSASSRRSSSPLPALLYLRFSSLSESHSVSSPSVLAPFPIRILPSFFPPFSSCTSFPAVLFFSSCNSFPASQHAPKHVNNMFERPCYNDVPYERTDAGLRCWTPPPERTLHAFGAELTFPVRGTSFDEKTEQRKNEAQDANAKHQ